MSHRCVGETFGIKRHTTTRVKPKNRVVINENYESLRAGYNSKVRVYGLRVLLHSVIG